MKKIIIRISLFSLAASLTIQKIHTAKEAYTLQSHTDIPQGTSSYFTTSNALLFGIIITAGYAYYSIQRTEARLAKLETEQNENGKRIDALTTITKSGFSRMDDGFTAINDKSDNILSEMKKNFNKINKSQWGLAALSFKLSLTQNIKTNQLTQLVNDHFSDISKKIDANAETLKTSTETSQSALAVATETSNRLERVEGKVCELTEQVGRLTDSMHAIGARGAAEAAATQEKLDSMEKAMAQNHGATLDAIKNLYTPSRETISLRGAVVWPKRN